MLFYVIRFYNKFAFVLYFLSMILLFYVFSCTIVWFSSIFFTVNMSELRITRRRGFVDGRMEGWKGVYYFSIFVIVK